MYHPLRSRPFSSDTHPSAPAAGRRGGAGSITCGDWARVRTAGAIANGGDFRPSERSLEYDTVSGKYAEFIEHEVLPLAEKTAHVMFTKDPELRGVIGQSSGSAAALAMAWSHPDWYHRVISYSGTFVNIQNNAEFPRGAWAYHETLIPNTVSYTHLTPADD